MIQVFIGYDSKEKVAFNVLAYSILKNSTKPVSITPIYLPNIRNIFKRERNSLSSTEFSFSRFMLPYLMNYEGWGIFMDCDQLMIGDIAKLWELRDDKYAVQLCKHDYQPEEDKKFLGQVQTKYEKKNWSSFMLMNSEKCRELTPDYVNTATGLQLHQFKWLKNDELIGELPLEWNWLVDEPGYNKKEDVYNIHFTKGGPWFKEYSKCSYSELWNIYHEECSDIEK
ncbi:MAG: glycosyltransferase [Gammaproteobacteria bacterium]|jgi:lipopolysaccharide biosynthesis glycosyltransferase|nr:glycosyltransferase [Gammaproteobacteria bacterium]MBT4462179.1 glycosyltransferase [Gammaproteobacteria bacterium]MBT4655038.1 glycosyltransferase [Gammaproteobacteria bacterium]MBT5116448.1 glycosyltransferase [Gammaproteobacteria bacterium]MBT5761150.1 glycosyltransferase [Gammaproteobacteria bacterium]